MACLAAQIVANGPISPGTYLRKRREAAGFGIRQAAASLAVLAVSLGRGRASRADDRTIARLALRLGQAEEDTLPFPTDQAQTLATVIPLDAQIYSQLVALHYAGPAAQSRNPSVLSLSKDPAALNDAGALIDLPIPHLCRSCACSWHDACVDGADGLGAPCSWSAHDPDLCTSCERKEAAAAELNGREPRLTLVAEPEIV